MNEENGQVDGDAFVGTFERLVHSSYEPKLMPFRVAAPDLGLAISDPSGQETVALVFDLPGKRRHVFPMTETIRADLEAALIAARDRPTVGPVRPELIVPE